MKNQKRVLAWCLILGVLLALVPVPGARAAEESWGSGTSVAWYSEGETEFQLATPQELAGLAELVNEGRDFTGRTVFLAANLDLAGKSWVPIGTEARPFRGTFDGRGHRVKNLLISLEQTGNSLAAGLFGAVEKAEVKDLLVSGSCTVLSAKDNFYVGGLAGKLSQNGKLINCAADAEVKVQAGKKGFAQYVGGLAGACSLGTVKNCFSTGSVAAEGIANAGALLGANEQGSVADCHYLEGACSVGVGSGNTAAQSFTGQSTDALLAALNGWTGKSPGYLPWVAGIPYPQFEAAREISYVTVSFDAAGGSPAPSGQEVVQGDKLIEPAAPSWTGREFLGWFAPGAEAAWDFDRDAADRDMTLTAHWSEPAKKTLRLDTAGQRAAYSGSAAAFEVRVTPQETEGWEVRYYQGDIPVSPCGAGTYDVRIFRAADAVYEAVEETVPGGLTVEPRAAELSWSGWETRAYTGVPAQVTAEVENLCPGDQCTVAVEGGGETDAGAHTARAVALSNPNYILPQTAVRDYEIVSAEVTVSLADSRVSYDGEVREASFRFMVEGDLRLSPESYTVEYRQEGQAVSPRLPGVYQVYFTLTDENFAFSEGEERTRYLGPLEIVADRYPYDIHWPEALALSYGDELSRCALENSAEQNGSFSWETPETRPQAGENQYFTAVFRPRDSAYPPVKKALPVTVEPREVALSLSGEKLFGEDPADLSRGELKAEGMLPGETDFSLLGDLRFSCAGNTREAPVGRYDITVEQTNAQNYRVTTKILKNAFEVKPGRHTLSGTDSYRCCLGEDAFTLTLSSSAGAPVAYELARGDAVAVTPEGVVTVLHAGQAEITATAERENYETARRTVTVQVTEPTAVRLPSPTSITADGASLRGGVQAGGPCAAFLEFRALGTETWTRKTDLQLAAGEQKTLACTLTGLAPGSVYEVRLGVKGENETLEERLSFRTLPGEVLPSVSGSVEGAAQGDLWVTASAGGVVCACVPVSGGAFTLPGLPDGVYQLTAEDTDHCAAGALRIQNRQSQGRPLLTLGAGDSRVSVEQGCLLAADGLGALADRARGELTLTARPASLELSRETREKVLPLAADQELGPVLEVNLSWETGESLSEPALPVTLWLPLTAKMREAKSFQVYRVHGGAAECVGALDGESVTRMGDLLEVRARRFSAYVVGYTLEKKPEPELPSGGGPSGGGDPAPPDETEHLCKKYSDLEGHWAQEAICAVTELGLFAGITETAFGPQVPMTRGMAVTVLWRLAGKPSVRTALAFADVEEGSWYAQAAAWARDRGILQGVGENRFEPNRALTRQELAALLFRYERAEAVGKDYVLARFEDGEDVAAWAKEAVLWAVDQGLLQGNGGKLEPARSITRAEVAMVIVRLQRRP